MPTPRPLAPTIPTARPFRVADALAAGESAERLRRSDLTAPVHGVRSANPSDSFDDFIDALTLVMRRDQFFSHATAAGLWGAPLPRRFQHGRPVHVLTAGTTGRMRRPGVVGHRSARYSFVDLDGRRVATPASAWACCASLLTVRELVVVGDHVVGRSGLATADDLARAIVPGSRHAVAARKALELVRVGAESAMETWMRLEVVDAGFPEPELNVEVHDDRGVLLGRVDMAWPGHRIALEYDGDHHRGRDTFRQDQRRDNGFVVNDWLVIHATAADARNPVVVFERLRQAFERRLVGDRRDAA